MHLFWKEGEDDSQLYNLHFVLYTQYRDASISHYMWRQTSRLDNMTRNEILQEIHEILKDVKSYEQKTIEEILNNISTEYPTLIDIIDEIKGLDEKDISL